MKKGIFTLTFFISTLFWGASGISAQDLEWAFPTGSTGADYGRGIVQDLTGAIYSTGQFTQTVDFDPGIGTTNKTSIGGADLYIRKSDVGGNLLWVHSIGGLEADAGTSIAHDQNGGVYIGGIFKGTVDFDPGAGVYNLTSNGNFDIFVMKLDASTGAFLWAGSFGGPGVDQLEAIHFGRDNRLYATGYFQWFMDMDPGPAIYQRSVVAGDDIFLSSFDDSGQFLWGNTFGSFGNDCGSDIATDTLGHVYLTGNFNSQVDFDPGVPIHNRVSNGGTDIFIQKLDNAGNFVWVKTMGSVEFDRGLAIDVSPDGFVVSSGFFLNSADFDPGIGVHTLTFNGGHDIYVQKLDPNGDFVWAGSIGGTGNDDVYSVQIDALGNVFCAGAFSGTLDFDPGPGTENVTAVGAFDAFVLKLHNNGNLLWVAPFGTTVNGQGRDVFVGATGDIFFTGGFEGTTDFDPGPNVLNHTSIGQTDLFELRLSECQPNGIQMAVTSCDSFLLNDTLYTSGGVHTQTFTNVDGCDSIVTLVLTLGISTNNFDTVRFCEGDSILFDGSYLSTSGDYTAIGQTPEGCDSIEQLNLTVHPIPGNGISRIGDSLLADIALNYQWVNCDDGFDLLPDDTNQIFSPVESGLYSVIVSGELCADTSECLNFWFLGDEEIGTHFELQLSPNPVKNATFLEFEMSGSQFVNLKLVDLTGRVHFTYLLNQKMHVGRQRLELKRPSGLADGMYFLLFESEKEHVNLPLLFISQ